MLPARENEIWDKLLGKTREDGVENVSNLILGGIGGQEAGQLSLALLFGRHEPETLLRYNGSLIHGRRVAPPPARVTECEEHMSDETKSTDRAIISVLGADRSGIVAAVASLLAERDVNILDISQTILQGMFTMTMLVDLAGADFSAIHDGFDALSKQLGVQITIQREDVFKFMYRL